jgi:predicted site-specific integrase-resolvase
VNINLKKVKFMSNNKQIQFVSTTPDELATLISSKVQEILGSQLKEIATTPEKKEFITREEASKLLNVTFATLWRYNKSGRLKAYKFQNKVYYKLSDIEAGFIKNV